MTWPDDIDLPVEVWAAFGADPDAVTGGEVWTDLSARLGTNPIPYRRGATAGGVAAPSSATIHLLNDDGALTPLYAQSEYWPHVALGTPIWLPIRLVEDAFGRTVSPGWGTSDSGHVWTSNTAASDYSVAGGVGRHSHGTINVLRRTQLSDVNLLDTHQVVDASTSVLITGAALVTGVVARYDGSGPTYYWCRTEFNAGATTVMLKITRVVDGSMTDLGSVAAVPGLAYAANTPLRTRVSIVGDRIAMKVWTASAPEPDGWQLEVTDPDPITTPGSIGLQSWVISGNTNVAPVVASFDNYAIRCDIVNGFADSWVPTFVPDSDGTVHSVVRVTVSGILRRLEQANDSRSPLTRFLPGTDPVAWWPLEDGVDSTQAASGLIGGTPLTVASGVMDFVDDAPAGASGSAHPDPSAANALTGAIFGGSAAAWQISIWSKGEVATEGTDAYYVAWEIVTDRGQVLRLAHQYEIDQAIGVAHWTDLTQTTPAHDVIMLDNNTPHLNPGITGDWMHVTFTIQQDGADCNVWLDLDEVTVASGTWAGVTIGAPVSIAAISPFGAGNATSLNMRNIWLSQIVLHNTASVVAQQAAGEGFPSEPASDRIERVCGERGIPVVIQPGESELLGRQPSGSDLDVLRDAELADMGILYERGWGLGWRPRTTLYNQEPALTIDLTEFMHSQDIRPDQVLAPTYDDKGVRNDVVVSRRDGSSHRSVDDAHVARHGRRPDKPELGLASDTQLEPQSGWRLYLGTWEEMRYSGVPVDLAGNPGLVEDWLRLQVGDRVRQTNPPPPHPPEDVEQLAAGMSGTLSRRGWTGNVVGIPARPWDVAVVDGDERVPADGSTLVADITDTDTNLLLASTVENGPWWVGNASTQPDDYPLPVLVGGEVVTVSEIEPSVVDGMARTVSNGWGTPDASYLGTAWAVVGTASNYNVVGPGTARMATPSTNTLYIAHLDIGCADAEIEGQVTVPVLPAGAPITPRLGGRYTDDSNYIEAGLNVMTSGVVQLQLFRRVGGSGSVVPGSGAVTVGSHAAGNAWIIRLAYSGDRIYARAWNATAGTDPDTWQVYGDDELVPLGTRIAALVRRDTSNSNGTQNIDWDNIVVHSPQIMTISARSVNGITRAWDAGTPIDAAEPAIVSL